MTEKRNCVEEAQGREKSAPLLTIAKCPYGLQLALAVGSALVKSGQGHPEMSQDNHLSSAFGGDTVFPPHASLTTCPLGTDSVSCSHLLCLSFSPVLSATP